MAIVMVTIIKVMEMGMGMVMGMVMEMEMDPLLQGDITIGRRKSHLKCIAPTITVCITTFLMFDFHSVMSNSSTVISFNGSLRFTVMVMVMAMAMAMVMEAVMDGMCW